MDEQTFLHQLSVKTNINIELLKDLVTNEKFNFLVKSGKTIDATILIRNLGPKVGLREAKMIAEAFAAEWKP